MQIFSVVLIMSCATYIQGMPYSRWFDYDDFPVAKPIQASSGNLETIGTVNPLRPYEPWILECIVFHSDKVEPGSRHERCRELDESNEKEYAKFLVHVQQWEEAYPERAARWNERFPDAKANEKKKYEQLKSFAEMHPKNLSEETSESSEKDMGEDSSESNTKTQTVPCTNCSTAEGVKKSK